MSFYDVLHSQSAGGLSCICTESIRLTILRLTQGYVPPMITLATLVQCIWQYRPLIFQSRFIELHQNSPHYHCLLVVPWF